jgi:hypothetical protein
VEKQGPKGKYAPTARCLNDLCASPRLPVAATRPVNVDSGHRPSEGEPHGQRSDAQQQGKEEAEGGRQGKAVSAYKQQFGKPSNQPQPMPGKK